MIQYLAAIAYLHLITLIVYANDVKLSSRKAKILAAALLAVPIIAFATLRGSSGSDTMSYINQYYAISGVETISDFLSFGPKIFFTSINYFLARQALPHEAFFLIQSTACAFFYFYALLNRQGAMFFISIAPAILINSVVNTLASGLAIFATLFLITTKVPRKYMLLPAGLHFSAPVIYFAPSLVANMERREGRTDKIIVAVIVLLSAFLLSEIFPVWQEYFLSKYNAYKGMRLPNWYSGLSWAFILSIALLYLVKSRTGSDCLSLLVSAAAIVLVPILLQQSWALARLAELLIIGLLFISHVHSSGQKFLVFTSAGLLFSLNFLFTVYLSGDYLPYG